MAELNIPMLKIIQARFNSGDLGGPDDGGQTGLCVPRRRKPDGGPAKNRINPQLAKVA